MRGRGTKKEKERETKREREREREYERKVSRKENVWHEMICCSQWRGRRWERENM